MSLSSDTLGRHIQKQLIRCSTSVAANYRAACIAQSKAIIGYLAEGSDLLPADAYQRAKTYEWLFWEQYSHEPYVAVCRFVMVYEKKPAQARESWRVERGEAALDLMEQTLAGQDWFAGSHVSIADIALIAYTRLAHEGGFELDSRPRVQSWIERTEGALGIS